MSVIPHVRICAGGTRRRVSLPRRAGQANWEFGTPSAEQEKQPHEKACLLLCFDKQGAKESIKEWS